MHRTIVVGTDGSEAAVAALEYARDLAERSDATLHVVTVIRREGSPMRFGVEDVAMLDDAALRLNENLRERFEDSPLEVITDIRRGKPGPVLVEYADTVNADLIVVGQTGAGGPIEGIIGSTAGHLARHADQPVTIVSTR